MQYKEKNGKEDDNDEKTFYGVEMSTLATQVDFETSNSRSFGLNIVGVRSSTSNIGVSTSGSTNNPFDRDAINASLGHSEGDETEADFSLYCTPTEDSF